MKKCRKKKSTSYVKQNAKRHKVSKQGLIQGIPRNSQVDRGNDKTRSLDLSRVRRLFQKMSGRQTDKLFKKRHLKWLFTPPSFFSAIQRHKNRDKKPLKRLWRTERRTNLRESRSTRLKIGENKRKESKKWKGQIHSLLSHEQVGRRPIRYLADRTTQKCLRFCLT